MSLLLDIYNMISDTHKRYGEQKDMILLLPLAAYEEYHSMGSNPLMHYRSTLLDVPVWYSEHITKPELVWDRKYLHTYKERLPKK